MGPKEQNRSSNLIMNRVVSAKFRIVFKSVLVLALSISLGATSVIADDDYVGDAANGENVFKGNCASCHLPSTKKFTGPGLKGIEDRRDIDWIIKWVQGSGDVIASGDPYAVKLFAEYNSSVMPNQAVTSDDIKDVLAFVRDYKDPEPVDVDGPKGPVEEEGTNTLTLFLILGALAALGLILFIANSKIDRFAKQKRGEAAPKLSGIAEHFKDWAGRNKRLVGLVVVLLIFGGLNDVFNRLMEIGVQSDYAPEQPINFSHKVHAGDQKIACVYCHFGEEKGKTAGIPPANV